MFDISPIFLWLSYQTCTVIIFVEQEKTSQLHNNTFIATLTFTILRYSQYLLMALWEYKAEYLLFILPEYIKSSTRFLHKAPSQYGAFAAALLGFLVSIQGFYIFPPRCLLASFNTHCVNTATVMLTLHIEYLIWNALVSAGVSGNISSIMLVSHYWWNLMLTLRITIALVEHLHQLTHSWYFCFQFIIIVFSPNPL